jgi:hypothetical protein
MLNRLTNKKLILKNYRMNDGISKALGEALKELNEYIETLGLESNDISDTALESKQPLLILFRYSSRGFRK